MKRSLLKCLAVVIAFAMCLVNSVLVLGHDDLLDIEYDSCQNSTGDGENESWYFLEEEISVEVLDKTYYFDLNYHIDHEVTTLKYYFADSLNGYYWDTNVSTENAEAVKSNYLKSMQKWANINYYTYDESGYRTSNKIINLVQGTSTDYNIIIYPVSLSDAVYNGMNYLALTGPKDFPELDINNIIEHYHFDKWEMKVSVEAMAANTNYNEYVGAHEMGHVLGLRDADTCCSASYYYHHEELLMGYATPRSTYAKYKDIAGVSITRGFHTDEDHAWMLRTNDDGTQDVICAQCNGVRYDVTLTDGKYEGKNVNIYQSCVHHGGTNQEMLLVANDGERYFYKCQYCRYIATYEKDNATQLSSTGTNVNITMTVPANSEIYYKVIVYDTYAYNLKSSNSLIDISVCDSGLSVINSNLTNASTSDGTEVILEDDNTYYLKIDNNSNFSQTVTIDIVGPHVHSFDSWVFISDTRHIEQCGCGVRGSTTSPHTFRMPDSPSDPRICIGCGYTKFLGGNGGNIIISISKVTVNGSYQMPDGTVYLVDSDIEAYLNGTLVFYDKDKLPVVQ